MHSWLTRNCNASNSLSLCLKLVSQFRIFLNKLVVSSNCLNDLPCCWSSIGITLRIASKTIQTFVQKWFWFWFQFWFPFDWWKPINICYISFCHFHKKIGCTYLISLTFYENFLGGERSISDSESLWSHFFLTIIGLSKFYILDLSDVP